MTDGRTVGSVYLRRLAKLWRHAQVGKLQIRLNRCLTSTVARWISHGDIIELGPAATSTAQRQQREILCHEPVLTPRWPASRI